MIETCEYCIKDVDDMCKASTDKVGGLGYRCTREEGHDGPHVACGTSNHEHHEWETEVSL